MGTINYDLSRLVSTHRGTLPVIITCPHDGKEKPADVPERDDRPAIKKKSDLRTSDIARGVAQSMLDGTGKDPYVVIAEFGREFIDANRSPPKEIPPDPDEKCGYDVIAAKEFHREYHSSIRRFTEEIRNGNDGVGLLLDIHGSLVRSEDPADIYLGTDNGRTIERLLGIDPEAMWSDCGLRGSLQGTYVISPTVQGGREVSSLDGGYTVNRYGSSKPNGIDAVQVEIVQSLRTNAAEREALIPRLAYAVNSFLSPYFILEVLQADL
jgi:N-formylglutamate amidohydrolase